MVLVKEDIVIIKEGEQLIILIMKEDFSFPQSHISCLLLFSITINDSN